MEGSNQQIAAEQPMPVAMQDDTAAVMALIARAASDPAFDVTKLEKLMDLRDRLAAGKAREAYAADFVQMKPHLPRVVSLHKNTQTNSRYAKLEDINAKIDPILAEYGFATSHKIVAQTDKQVTATVELWHRAGHVESTTLSMPLDDSGIAGKVNKTAPHAIASTIMYLRRVGECALLNISTGNDLDGNTDRQPDNSVITTEHAVDIDTRARALGDKYHSKFLEWLGVTAANEIKESDYKKAADALAETEDKKKAKEQKAKEPGV
jgi:hypothetical protein